MTVRAAIDSVMSQTYGHWELIIVDDGSTDATGDVLSEFSNDDRVRVLSGPHIGVCKPEFGLSDERHGWCEEL